MTLGRIHSFETFGAADGPGVRFITFLSGCPFRCAYCHNPDTWARPPAFEMSAEDVLSRALRYRPYWGTEGGLTLSGGEPLAQAAFGADLFQRAHAAGVTTCLDTAGGPFAASDAAQIALLDVTDTVILDLKLFDEAAHRRLTGASNASVLACARACAERGRALWIRRVLVPGLTDDPDDLSATGAFIASLGAAVKRVEVLPYHTLGVAKWHALGLPYALEAVRPPTPEEIQEAKKRLNF